jgi:nucleoside-diphosphate-sugar epimerase
MSKKKIAILGATSHIAKSIIYNFVKNGRAAELILFARSVEKVNRFILQIQSIKTIPVFSFENFSKAKYSAIINCVGFGNPKKLSKAGAEIFEVTEKFDNLAIEYIKTSTQTLYINLSSGAVYGDFVQPANENTSLTVFPNQILLNQYYSIVKFYSEVKHRAYSDLNIVDLRIFGYFSRFIDLDAGYFLSDTARCILNKTVLATKKEDIVRDYIHPMDLYQLILRCIEKEKINCVLDAYSKKPITKFDVLRSFHSEFGLHYKISNTADCNNSTGLKSNYYSESRGACNLGYKPSYSSLEGLIEEMRAMQINLQ